MQGTRRAGGKATQQLCRGGGVSMHTRYIRYGDQTFVYKNRMQRLRQGDPLEKQYLQRLWEMKEEEKRGIVWRLASGVICERRPLILHQEPAWEKEFNERNFE